MPAVKPPSELDFTNASEMWPEWKKRFARYRSAADIDAKTAQKQVDILIFVMGEEAEKIFPLLTVAPDTSGTPANTLYARTLAAFDAYFQPRDCSLHYSILFSNRVQGNHKSNEEYIRALYELVTKCNWGDAQQVSMLRTRILAGMRDKELSRELQLDDRVTLDTIKSRMRAKEIILKHQREEVDGLGSSSSSVVNSVGLGAEGGVAPVNAINRKWRGQTTPHSDKKLVSDCKYCGGSHAQGRCPAYGKRCNTCNLFNHFARACKQGRGHRSDSSLKTLSVEVDSQWEGNAYGKHQALAVSVGNPDSEEESDIEFSVFSVNGVMGIGS